MAITSAIEREKRVAKTVKKYEAKRAQIKNEIKELMKQEDNYEALQEAYAKLQKLPRDASPVRQQSRCKLCGRPHAVYKKLGLCRICVRETFRNGWLPGFVMSSW